MGMGPDLCPRAWDGRACRFASQASGRVARPFPLTSVCKACLCYRDHHPAGSQGLGVCVSGTHLMTRGHPTPQENQTHQRIAELRKAGLWSPRRLPKLQEAPRPRAHWDYLLEEMQWMATDFAQERRWKVAAAKKVGWRRGSRGARCTEVSGGGVPAQLAIRRPSEWPGCLPGNHMESGAADSVRHCCFYRVTQSTT